MQTLIHQKLDNTKRRIKQWWFNVRVYIKNIVKVYRNRYPRYGLNPFRKKPKDASFWGFEILRMEVTSLCNANCTFCTYQFNNRPRISIETEIFQKAVRDFSAGGGGKLDLSPVVGDALIDRDLEKKIAFAKSFPNITGVYFFTNGILLSRERFDALAEAGLDHITISMTSFDPQEYEQVYRSKKYKTVVSNLYAITESPYFKKLHPDITVKTGIRNCRSQPDFKALKSKGYLFWVLHDVDNWNNQISESNLPEGMSFTPKSETLHKSGPCQQLVCVTVRADGSMTYCGCRDDRPQSDLNFGNIKNMALDADALDPNGVLAKATAQFMNDNPDDLPDVCKDCTLYRPWGGVYPKYKQALKVFG